VFVHGEPGARTQQAGEAAQRFVGGVEVADQIGGQDAVDGPTKPASARSTTRLCTNRTESGHRFPAAIANIPAEASTATIRAAGAAASRAAVEASVPRLACSSRDPRPPAAI